MLDLDLAPTTQVSFTFPFYWLPFFPTPSLTGTGLDSLGLSSRLEFRLCRWWQNKINILGHGSDNETVGGDPVRGREDETIMGQFLRDLYG